MPPRGTKVPRCHGVASSSVAPTVEQPMVVPRVFALRANICYPLKPLLLIENIYCSPSMGEGAMPLGTPIVLVWDPKGISATKGGTVVLPKVEHRRVPFLEN